MYLRLEDWSVFLYKLEDAMLPHGEHIIKVYPSEADPRSPALLGRANIALFEVNAAPFSFDELFEYEGRGRYSGLELEKKLQELGIEGQAAGRFRALFRFANKVETGFTQTAMALKNQDGGWLIDHPFGDIDGWQQILTGRLIDPEKLHLDVFIPESLEKLAKLLQVDHLDNCEKIISYSERKEWRRKTLLEGANKDKER